MLEKRAVASAQVVERGTDGEPEASSAEAQRGWDATRRADTDSEGRFADDGDDTDPEGCFADDGGNDDPEGHDEDDDDEGADQDDCEPKVSAREKTLAWLAEESVGENLPAPTARTSGGGSVARIVLPKEPPEFVRPDAVKGIYLNAWAAGSAARSQALIDLATRTEVNTFVIDLKDASGYVSYALSGPTSTTGACGTTTSIWRKRLPRSASLRSSGTTSVLLTRPKRISTEPSTRVPRGVVAETPSRRFWSTPGPNWRIPASP